MRSAPRGRFCFASRRYGRILAFALAIAAFFCFSPAVEAADASDNGQIGGTGRIVPNGGVIGLSVPAGAVLRSILVHQGDAVRHGDPLLVFDDGAAQAEEEIATLDLQTATAAAAQEANAEDLALTLAQDKYQRAQKDAADYRALGAGGTSQSELSRLDGAAEETRIALEIEKLKDQRAHIETANAVQAAARRLEIAKAKSAALTVRAPSDGIVLRIDRNIGEAAGDAPVAEFADISAMYVDCQIYEGQVVKIKRGDRATIKSAAVPDIGGGVVEEISRMIDTRGQLGDVLIRLDHPNPAALLVGMEVEVVIAP